MLRALKWILIVVLAVVLVVVGGALIYLNFFFDPNDYRDEIARRVEAQTGRELVIEGDLEVAFIPWLALETGAMRLSDAEGFGEEPFLALNKAYFAVKLWPLIARQEVELDRVVVDGLKLRLIRNAQGVGNWESLAAQQPAAPAEPQPEQPGQDGGAPVALASLGGFELNEASVLFEDRAQGSRYLIEPLRLEVGAFEPGEPVSVDGSWALQSADAPELRGEISTVLRYAPAEQTLALEDLALQLLARGEQLPGGELPLKLTGDVTADLAASSYRAPALRLQVAEVPMQLEVVVNMPPQGLAAQASLDLPKFNARALMQRLGMEVPETADADALTAVAAQAKLAYGSDGLRVQALRVQLDDTTLTGEASIRAFAPVAGSFQLAVDRIDLDRYLPPPAEGEAPATPASAGAAAAELPLDMLRELQLNGVISVGELVVRGMQVSDVRAELKAANGILTLEPVSAKLYGGDYRGRTRIDVTGPQPVVSVNERLSGVQAGPLLADLAEKAYVSGKANVDFAATMRGASVDEWLRTADGQGRFEFLDGAVQGVNIAAQLRRARAQLRNEPLPPDEMQETDFTALTGTITLSNGTAVNRDLKMLSPLFRVTGEGRVNLVEQTVQYLLTINLVETLKGQGGKPLEDLNKIPIPIRITGPLGQPEIKVDLVEAFKQSQGEKIEEVKQQVEAEAEKKKAEVEQKLEQEQQRLEDKAKQEIENKLQDLLRQKK